MDPDLPNQFRQTSRAGAVFLGLLFLAVAVTAFAWLSGPRKQNRALMPQGPAPIIAAAGWVNGEAPTPESLAGKVIVIDVWATWCKPCRDALPHMVELHERFADRGVVFLGLTDEGEKKLDAIQRVLGNAGARWPNGWGATQTIQDLNAVYLPSVYVIGTNGQIMWTSADRGELSEILEQLLKPAKPT
ncbi:MAG: redoxin domain-containing protein [Planctomycetaceae bacterium]